MLRVDQRRLLIVRDHGSRLKMYSHNCLRSAAGGNEQHVCQQRHSRGFELLSRDEISRGVWCDAAAVNAAALPAGSAVSAVH